MDPVHVALSGQSKTVLTPTHFGNPWRNRTCLLGEHKVSFTRFTATHTWGLY